MPAVATLDALALTFAPRAIAGIYATHFMALSLLSFPLTAVLALAWQLGRRWRAPLRLMAATLFFLIFFYAVRTVAIAWGARYGATVPLLWWLTATVPLSLFLARYASTLLDNLIGFSWFLALVGAVCVPFAFIDVDATPPAAPVAAPAVRPDILLVTIDTLAARQMSLYGASQSTTPNIDRLAQRGLMFDRAYAGANFTTAGINTLLTGRYPDEHRSLQLGGRALPRYRATSLPALLQRAGYRSTYVSTNSYAAPWRNGYARYFDNGVGDATRWRVYVCEDELVRWLPYVCQVNHPAINLITPLLIHNDTNNLEYDGRLVTRAAQSLMASIHGDQRPLFLWVHLFPPHDPYAAPSGCLGHFYPGPQHRTAATSQPIYGLRPAGASLRTTRLLEQRYRESLWCADRTVGQIVEQMRRRDRPFVLIITADHGESFTPVLTGHGGPWLNEDAIRIPLLVALPGMTRPRRSATIASQTDVLPIVRAILDGADADRLAALVAARRRAEPALSMEFIDNRRLAPLTRGGVAAIGERGKYIRYLSPPGPFRALADQSSPGAASDTREGRQLRATVAARLARYGNKVNP